MEAPFKTNDIVRIKAVDYSKLEPPKEPAQAKEFRQMVGGMTALQGKVMRVVGTRTIDSNIFVTVEGLVDRKLKIGKDEHPIAFKAEELELIETDWMNNCCAESLRSSAMGDDYDCSVCGCDIKSVLLAYEKPKAK